MCVCVSGQGAEFEVDLPMRKAGADGAETTWYCRVCATRQVRARARVRACLGARACACARVLCFAQPLEGGRRRGGSGGGRGGGGVE